VKNVAAAIRIKLGQIVGLLSDREPAADYPPGRCTCDQMEKLARAFCGRVLDPLENAGGDNPPDATTIHAQNSDDLVCHGRPLRNNGHC
jgi:hypothetical protein